MSTMGIATKLISLFVAGGIFLMLYKRVKVLKKYGLISLAYLLLSSILLAFPTLLLMVDLAIGDLWILLIAQTFILLVGVVHLLQNPAMLPWYKDQAFKVQILFLACIIFLAYFFSDLSLSFLVNPKLRIVWYLSLLWFIIPSLLNETVNLLLKVPPREYKKWTYPINERVDDPSDEELDNPLVIGFVFKKNEQSKTSTSFKAKAPVGMQLGRLFYFFINDYNSRHPESQISYVNQEGEPYGWVFMKAGKKLFGNKKAMDPDDSIYGNNIRENDELFCNRV